MVEASDPRSGTPFGVRGFAAKPVVSLVPRSTTGYWLGSLRDLRSTGIFAARGSAASHRTPSRDASFCTLLLAQETRGFISLREFLSLPSFPRRNEALPA